MIKERLSPKEFWLARFNYFMGGKNYNAAYNTWEAHQDMTGSIMVDDLLDLRRYLGSIKKGQEKIRRINTALDSLQEILEK